MQIPNGLLLALFFLLADPVNLPGQNRTETVVLEDLRLSWKVFDRELGQLVPYLSNRTTTEIHFNLPTFKYSGDQLRLCLPPDHYLFFNNQLVRAVRVGSCMEYKIDSLIKAAQNRTIQVSIQSLDLHASEIQTLIIDQNRANNFRDHHNTPKISMRPDENASEFILLSIFFLGLLVIVRAQRYKLFSDYFSWSHAFSISRKSDVLFAQSPLARERLIFIGLYSLLLSFSVIFLLSGAINYMGSIKNYFSDTYLQIALLALVVFFMMFIKLPLIRMVSSLFQLKQLQDLHFYTYFRLSLIISIVLFATTISIKIFNLNTTLQSSVFIPIAGYTAFIVRSLIVFLALNNKLSFSKLHLFFYLCTTEIVPLILFINIFLK